MPRCFLWRRRGPRKKCAVVPHSSQLLLFALASSGAGFSAISRANTTGGPRVVPLDQNDQSVQARQHPRAETGLPSAHISKLALARPQARGQTSGFRPAPGNNSPVFTSGLANLRRGACHPVVGAMASPVRPKSRGRESPSHWLAALFEVKQHGNSVLRR